MSADCATCLALGELCAYHGCVAAEHEHAHSHYAALMAGTECPMHVQCSANVLASALAEARAAETHDFRLSRVDVTNLIELTCAWNADRVARNAGPPLTFEGALSRLLQATRDLVAGKDS